VLFAILFCLVILSLLFFWIAFSSPYFSVKIVEAEVLRAQNIFDRKAREVLLRVLVPELSFKICGTFIVEFNENRDSEVVLSLILPAIIWDILHKHIAQVAIDELGPCFSHDWGLRRPLFVLLDSLIVLFQDGGFKGDYTNTVLDLIEEQHV